MQHNAKLQCHSILALLKWRARQLLCCGGNPGPVVLQMTWVTFHSMYDFGYLLKCLMGRKLPDTEKEFFQMLKVRCFPQLITRWVHSTV